MIESAIHPVIPTATLAVDLGDILSTLIMLAVVVFGVIGSIVQSVKQNSNRPQRDRNAQESSQDQPTRQAPAERLGELAERRRQQLEELARRRRAAQQERSGSAPPAPPRQRRPSESPRPEPAEARQTGDDAWTSTSQRADKERRAKAERDRESHERQLERQRELRRRAEADLKEQRETRQRQAGHLREAQAERREQQRQLQLEAIRGQRRQQAAAATGTTLGLGSSLASAHGLGGPTDPSIARRSNPHAAFLRDLASAGPEQLQRAVLLREVLGQPVGLRDASRLPMDG